MHKTVLLNEAIDNLNIKEDGIYVDCTLGFGGHSGLILERIKRGFLFAFDQDDMALEYSEKKLKEIGSNFELIKSNFAYIKEELNKRNVTEVDGIVFDLGVSSPQLDIADRGFSFHKDAKLDMRMDTTKELSAYNVVNEYSYEELVRVIRDYGEEKYATSIAKNIVKDRESKPIETTFELVDIIKKSMPYKAMKDSHPARRTFQAIRIEVNNEIKPLYNTVLNSIDVLKENGRLCIITFHSLEDRAVKNAYIEAQGHCTCQKELPYCVCNYKSYGKIINKKPIEASEQEKEENSRSKSAKLRIFERHEKK